MAKFRRDPLMRWGMTNYAFRPISFFISETIQDRPIVGYSYWGTSIGTRMQSVEQCHFKRRWLTSNLNFKVTINHLKMVYLKWQTSTKSYMICRMVTFSITFFSSSSNTVQGSVEHYRTGDFTLNDPKPDNQVFFKPFFNPTDGPVDVYWPAFHGLSIAPVTHTRVTLHNFNDTGHRAASLRQLSF